MRAVAGEDEAGDAGARHGTLVHSAAVKTCVCHRNY